MMEIRTADLKDVEELSHLFHAYRHLSVSLENSATITESEQWLEDRINHGEAAFLVAERNGSFIGFATLYQGFSSVSLQKYWTLNDLYVKDEARGLGVGNALMAKADKFALDTNAKGIELETAISNTVAQSMYEKLGYVENTKYKSYFKPVSRE